MSLIVKTITFIFLLWFGGYLIYSNGKKVIIVSYDIRVLLVKMLAL